MQYFMHYSTPRLFYGWKRIMDCILMKCDSIENSMKEYITEILAESVTSISPSGPRFSAGQHPYHPLLNNFPGLITTPLPNNHPQPDNNPLLNNHLQPNNNHQLGKNPQPDNNLILNNNHQLDNNPQLTCMRLLDKNTLLQKNSCISLLLNNNL